jgi:hypothetical protein
MEVPMTLTILDPRSGQQVTISIPDRPAGSYRRQAPDPGADFQPQHGGEYRCVTDLDKRPRYSRRIVMVASVLSFRLAVLFVIAGMAMGIGMAVSQNHSIMPAHAHLNLLGWVSLFLFGIYYERRPALDTSRLALIQVVLWSVGTIVLTIAVAALHLGYPAADPVAGIASLVVLAAMLLFAYFVFRPAHSMAPGATMQVTPAE